MKFSAKPPTEVRVDLTSLIDVVFLLLLFFMLTTTFDRSQKAIDYRLPEAESGGAEPQPKAMNLILDRQGKVFHGDQPLDEAQLESLLAEWEAQEGGTGRTVVIHADLEAQHGKVVSLMDRLRRRRFLNIAIGVEPSANP